MNRSPSSSPSQNIRKRSKNSPFNIRNYTKECVAKLLFDYDAISC